MTVVLTGKSGLMGALNSDAVAQGTQLPRGAGGTSKAKSQPSLADNLWNALDSNATRPLRTYALCLHDL